MTPIRRFAGIGSRETPRSIRPLIDIVCDVAVTAGFTLVSGGADGADSMFENAYDERWGCKEIRLPWPGFNGNASPLTSASAEAWEIAAQHHPAWSSLSRGAKALHARNVHQVLGADCRSPVEFVVYWTMRGQMVGGTGQALRIASAYDIECVSLWSFGDRLFGDTMLGEKMIALCQAWPTAGARTPGTT